MTRRIIITHKKQNFSQSNCRALVLMDSSQLKREEKKKCRHLNRKLEAAQKIFEYHESRSVREYQKWFLTEFEEEIGEIRRLVHSVDEKKRLIDAVLTEAVMRGCSERRAYENVLEMKTRFEEQARRMESEGYKYDRYNGDTIRARFEEIYGSRENWTYRNISYEEAFSQFSNGFQQEEESTQNSNQSDFKSSKSQRKKKRHKSSLDSASSSEEARIKEIYRELARKLHPDINPGQDAKSISLWYEVQEAYQNNNLRRLEALSSASVALHKSWGFVDSLSSLRAVYKDLSSRFSQLQHKIQLAKKHISWNFQEKLRNPLEMRRLERNARAELESDLSSLQEEEHELDIVIGEWTQSKKSKKKKMHPTSTFSRYG